MRHVEKQCEDSNPYTPSLAYNPECTKKLALTTDPNPDSPPLHPHPPTALTGMTTLIAADLKSSDLVMVVVLLEW
ncbi:hypothetical protein Pmani_024933 [Petrolisthes manimaculis]|uniref:Uncharacterized protein n=1 Tax=Petrolisthes manimaculis TaxID=1843537 RepID=A0AAE1P961_9EUCA|nr:hypothetical protein Pmani_024933 [Petrolisthes manimaculis]